MPTRTFNGAGTVLAFAHSALAGVSDVNAELEYRLFGRGWCECRFQAEGVSVVVTGSYLTDTLYEFCTAVQAIIAGSEEARFSFEEEPGEYRWLLTSIDPAIVRVRVFEFRSMRISAPDSAGSLLIDVQLKKGALAHALYSAMTRLVEEFGLDGYKEKWVLHPFPTERYRQLGATLGIVR